ncbi:MAG: hypothetical protein WA817_23840 [Candidatus Acidiferrum sp.]
MPALSKPKLAERQPDDLRLQREEIKSTIQKLDRAARRAMSLVRTEGVEIWKLVMDARGASRRVRRINPAVKRLRECETSIRSLRRTLQRVEDELAAIEAAAKRQPGTDEDSWDWLDVK